MDIELKLNKYFVTDYKFEQSLDSINESFNPNEFKFHFEREVRENGDNEVLITLRFVHEKDNNNPFAMIITVNGIFQMEKWKSNNDKRFIMIENTTSILFPYLRSLVSNMTANALGKAFVIPVMNTYALFNSPKKENEN